MYVPTPPLRAISLFAGAGGDTLGLERAGFTVTAFSEMNKVAIATHLANFPGSTHLKGEGAKGADISLIPDAIFAQYKGGVDIIFGGFPCQGLSKAGKKKADDPRNQMYLQFVRAVRVVQPRFLIGENVAGLLTMKSTKPEGGLLLEDIRTAFAAEGYTLSWKILEATDYGVPQKRKRLLIVGWRADIPFDASGFWAGVAAQGAAWPVPTLRSFVLSSLEGAYTLPDSEMPEGFDSVALELPPESAAAPSGKPHPFVVLKAGEKLLSCSKRDSPVHSEIINLDRPAKTIICTYDHQPRLLVGLKRKGVDGSTQRWIRTLLPEELQQIQGFPAGFSVLGTTKEKVVQIGNAVPPALVTAVALELAHGLEGGF